MEIELSKKQMDRVKYEAMLLKISPQQLYNIAPHVFNEGITAANTKIEEPIEKEEEIEEEEIEEEKLAINRYYENLGIATELGITIEEWFKSIHEPLSSKFRSLS
jgi:hypothetical protein